MSATSVSVNACHTNNISHFHTRGRTNRLDGQIVSDEQIVRCANRNEQIFPRRFARRDEHNLRSGVFLRQYDINSHQTDKCQTICSHKSAGRPLLWRKAWV